MKKIIRKGKTYEELYGIEKAIKIKSKLKGNTGPKKYYTPWNKGLSLKDERIRKYVEKRNKTINSKEWKNTIEQERRIKISENAKINPNYGMKGKHHSESTIKKIRKNFVYKICPICKQQFENVPSIMKNKNFCSQSCSSIFIRTGRKHSKETIEKCREARAKQILPIKDTSIEIKLQNFLKQLNIEFFTHQYMHIEHGYQCDIFIPNKNLVIECDGNYWHSYPTGNEIDHIRTSELLAKGFKVLRLWEVEIKKMTIDEFKEKLKNDKN